MRTRLATCIFAATTLVLVSNAYARARLEPIRNYDIPIATGSGKVIPAEAVREVIIAAGQRGRRKWAFSNGGEDKLIGVLAVRAHRIEVELEYSPERVWVRYKSSEHLKVDNGNIHRNYNKWVGELVNAMRVRLTRL